MKKIVLTLLVLFSANVFLSAKEQVPADVKALTDKITKITTEYSNALLKVKSARDLADAINKYASRMEKLVPEIKAIEAKYGAMMEDEEEDDNPEDLEAFQNEWAAQLSGESTGADFQKFAEYYSDPAVQKALARLNRIMDSIGVSEDEDSYDEE